MGFSSIGTLIALSIFAPNLLMIIYPPKGLPASRKKERMIYTLLERIGQVGCIGILVISQDSFQRVRFSLWVVPIALSIAAYYCLWIRYVVKGQEYKLLWEPVGYLPIPMAVLPVCAFGFAAVWCNSIWLGVAVICFAVGHFANSWNSYQEVN